MDLQQRSEIIQLAFPIQLADRLLTEVTMRRPLMRDLRKYPVKNEQDTETEFRLFAALTNLRVEELDCMDAVDYDQLQQTYLRFRTSAKPGGNARGGAGAVPSDPLGPE